MFFLCSQFPCLFQLVFEPKKLIAVVVTLTVRKECLSTSHTLIVAYLLEFAVLNLLIAAARNINEFLSIHKSFTFLFPFIIYFKVGPLMSFKMSTIVPYSFHKW